MWEGPLRPDSFFGRARRCRANRTSRNDRGSTESRPARSQSERKGPSHIESDRRQGGINVRENDKNLVEPRDFENRFHVFLNSRQNKFAAVPFHVLHSLDQNCEAGAV